MQPSAVIGLAPVATDYGPAATLREAAGGFDDSALDLDEDFGKVWGAANGDTRSRFLVQRTLELRNLVWSPLTARDVWEELSLPSVPDNLLNACRRVDEENFLIDPEAFRGRWLMLRCRKSGVSKLDGETVASLSIGDNPHEHLAIYAWKPKAKKIHKIMSGMKGEKYAEALVEKYPYDEVGDQLAAAPDGTMVTLYGRLRTRVQVPPFYLFEVWKADFKVSEQDMLIADRLKESLICDFEGTPFPAVLEFLSMASRCNVKQEGGVDVRITLSLDGDSLMSALDGLSDKTGLQWVVDESGAFVFKRKAGEDELKRKALGKASCRSFRQMIMRRGIRGSPLPFFR